VRPRQSGYYEQQQSARDQSRITIRLHEGEVSRVGC
jgi:hypothetical protein